MVLINVIFLAGILLLIPKCLSNFIFLKISRDSRLTNSIIFIGHIKP